MMTRKDDYGRGADDDTEGRLRRRTDDDTEGRLPRGADDNTEGQLRRGADDDTEGRHQNDGYTLSDLIRSRVEITGFRFRVN